MNFKSILLKVTILSIALTLVNCSPKESTRKRSFNDGDFEINVEEQLTTQDQSEAARLEGLLLTIEPIVISQLNEKGDNVDAPMLLQRVLTPLREIVLNKDYLSDPDTRFLINESGLQLVPRLVTLYNQALALTYKRNGQLIKNTDILAKYKSIIFWDCDQELKGSCEFIKFYRTVDSTNMSYIMKIIASQEVNDDEKLRIVKAIYDVTNRRLDGSLRFMLLERIAESFKQEKAGKISRERLKQDADLFANILKINNIDTDTKTKYIKLMKANSPLLLSRNRDDPKNPAMTDLIKIAGKELIYEGEGSKITPQLKEAIDQLGYIIGPQYEQGVDFQKENIKGLWKERFAGEASTLNKVQAQVKNKVKNNPDVELFGAESKNILTNMLSDVSFEKRDEYYFLAHQIFYGHYNIDDAASFWSMTNKDQKRFMEATLSLVKMQIVNNIVFTNTRMNNFYNRNKGTKLIELLRESDKEGSKIRKAWSKLIIRSKAMKSFASRVVTKDSPEKIKQLDQISNSVDALTKNIKFLVTYPNMFPLMHILASLEMKDTIRTFFGDFTIDSQFIIDLFFSGRLAPLFNFGNDGVGLDGTEIIYAYYYSLTTEIFKTYSTNEVVKFSAEDFFKVVVKKLLLAGEKRLDESIRELTTKRKEFSNSVNALKAACTEEKMKQAQQAKVIEEKIKSGNFDWVRDFHSTMESRVFANNQVTFNELGRSIYDPTYNQSGKAGKYIREVVSKTVANNFHRMRDSQYKAGAIQTVQLAQTLLDVYKAYNKDGNQDEIEKIFKEQFQEYNRLKAEYTKLYLEIDKEVDGCEWAFMARDRDLRHGMVFREVKFLEALFDEMDRALLGLSDSERANLSEEKQQEIEAIRVKFTRASQDAMFPQEYRDRNGYTKITPSRITTFKMDIYARAMSYLNELYKGQYSVSAPSNFKTAGIYAESDAKFIYFDWALKDRKLAKEKFVNSGVKVFANALSWAREAVNLEVVESKLEVLVSLYKLNTVSINADVDCNQVEPGTDIFEKSCVKVSASDLIAYYKKILDHINLDERDEIILNLIGEDKKYDEAIYDGYIKVKNEHRLYSYYDMIFRRIMSDADVSAPESTWFMGTLLKYVNSVHNRRGSTYIFAYPDTIEAIFVKNYEVWLNNYFENNKEFIKEVKKQVDAGVEPFQFKYRMDRTHTVGASNIGKLDPLVSNLIYGKFTGFTQQMDNNTSRYFSEIITTHKKKINEVIAGQE